MERAVIEILNENHEPIDGLEYGEITLTGLDNPVMPLVRYQPGDLARFRTDLQCHCQNPSPLIELGTRSTDVFQFADGTYPAHKILKLFGLEPFVSSIRRFQVRQDTTDSISILIEARNRGVLPYPVIKTLAQKIRNFQGVPAHISIHVIEVESITGDDAKTKVFLPLNRKRQNTKTEVELRHSVY